MKVVDLIDKEAVLSEMTRRVAAGEMMVQSWQDASVAFFFLMKDVQLLQKLMDEALGRLDEI